MVEAANQADDGERPCTEAGEQCLPVSSISRFSLGCRVVLGFILHPGESSHSPQEGFCVKIRVQGPRSTQASGCRSR